MLRLLSREERVNPKAVTAWLEAATRDKDMRTTCKHCWKKLTFKQVSNRNSFCSSNCGSTFNSLEKDRKKKKQEENKISYKAYKKNNYFGDPIHEVFGNPFDCDGNIPE